MCLFYNNNKYNALIEKKVVVMVKKVLDLNENKVFKGRFLLEINKTT